MQSTTQSLSNGGDNVKTFMSKQEIKPGMTSPIMLLHLGLGLASQEVDVLANSTNENSRNFYVYDKMTQPQLSIQTQV